MPLISKPLRFWLPVAWRAASKLATAPPENRARNRTVSSTVTLPVPSPALHARGDAAGGRARHQLALLDERLGDRAADLGDLLAGDEAGHVDDVGVQVAVGAGAGQLLSGTARQRDRLVGPVLEVERPDVADRRRAAPSLTSLWARATAGQRR